jgi:hypothetical protein
MAQTIKKGMRIRDLADDVEIIDRQDRLVLAKITCNGTTFLDISSVQVDSYGAEHFVPSQNNNGLTEITQGSQKVPKPFGEMMVKFNELVENNRRVEASQKASFETREQRTMTRAARIRIVRDFRDQARTNLAAVVNAENVPIESILDNKKAMQYASEINFAEEILNIIR